MEEHKLDPEAAPIQDHTNTATLYEYPLAPQTLAEINYSIYAFPQLEICCPLCEVHAIQCIHSLAPKISGYQLTQLRLHLNIINYLPSLILILPSIRNFHVTQVNME